MVMNGTDSECWIDGCCLDNGWSDGGMDGWMDVAWAGKCGVWMMDGEGVVEGQVDGWWMNGDWMD